MARTGLWEEKLMIKVKGKGGITAKIIANSVSSVSGDRITTFELEYHRYIHGEVMTHRVFSRNAASSRAIPVKNMLELVRNSPAMPIHWGKNQAGMQAKEECDEPLGFDCELSNGWTSTNYLTRDVSWKAGANSAATLAEKFSEAGYHKQIVNRLVEPFQMIKVVVTATSFDNFFWLRFHEDAQPEIAELARCMLVAYKRSKPQELNPGQWHVPYVDVSFDESGIVYSVGGVPITEDYAIKVSASCCAQVSYRKSDNSLEKAEAVWERLVASQPVHASPTEHQATPMQSPEGFIIVHTEQGWHNEFEKGVTGRLLDTAPGNLSSGMSNNFKGWIQHRALIANNVCNSYDYSQDVDENGLEITDEESV
jgi:hypothetical protein